MNGQDRAVTWANEDERRRDLRHRRIANFKFTIARWWHRLYWKVLHFTQLARPYSVAMCWAGLYSRFPDGRCMWCGEIHPKEKP